MGGRGSGAYCEVHAGVRLGIRSLQGLPHGLRYIYRMMVRTDCQTTLHQYPSCDDRDHLLVFSSHSSRNAPLSRDGAKVIATGPPHRAAPSIDGRTAKGDCMGWMGMQVWSARGVSVTLGHEGRYGRWKKTRHVRVFGTIWKVLKIVLKNQLILDSQKHVGMFVPFRYIVRTPREILRRKQ